MVHVVYYGSARPLAWTVDLEAVRLDVEEECTAAPVLDDPMLRDGA